MRALAVVLTTLLMGSGCHDDTPSQGGLNEDCYPNRTCDLGLVCRDFVCVEPSLDSSTDAPTDGTEDTNYSDVDLACTSDGDCDDADPCTVESCDVDGYCQYEDLDADGDGYVAREIDGVACGGTDCNDADETVGLQECSTVDFCCDGCTRLGCWYDEVTGYIWEEPPVNEDIPYANAELYCSRLVRSGLGEGEWRLPTISELRTLIRGCPSTEAGGACGLTDACTSAETCDPDWPNACVDVCDEYLGPAENGCYWNPVLHDNHYSSGDWTACGTYYSSTPSGDSTAAVLAVFFTMADVGQTTMYMGSKVRCIHTGE